MSTRFSPPPSAAAAPPASTDAADVGLAACASVVCVADSADELPKAGTVVLIVAELVRVVGIYVFEVSLRLLHGDADLLPSQSWSG